MKSVKLFQYRHCEAAIADEAIYFPDWIASNFVLAMTRQGFRQKFK